LVAGDSTTPLKDENFESNNELEDVGIVYSKLKNRSQVTVKNVYIKPIIKDLKIDGYIYLNSLADRIKADGKIRDALYSYLDENADFDVNVYVSNLIELIESFPEVHHADIRLVSNDEFYEETLTNSRFTSATGISGVSATYNTDPIGKVYNEELNERPITNPPIYNSYDIYSWTLSDLLKDYSDNTRQAILLLLPQLETVTYKVDPTVYGGSKVETDIVWPSKNIWNKKYCRVAVSTDTNEADLIRDFVPSERNFYIGMMNCVYNKLKMLATDNKSNSQILDYVQKYISNKDTCVGCSLKNLNTNTFNTDFVDSIFGKDISVISKADPLEVSDFLNTKFSTVVDIFRNTFINDLQNGILDDYSNAVNFTIKNEIVRIKAPELQQYTYYR
jgi:hypothetical protein